MLDNVRAFFQRWGTFLLIGAVVFIVAYVFVGRKQAKAVAGGAQPLLPGQSMQPGANGQPVIEYVPTTGDSYTNVNYALDSNNVTNQRTDTTTTTTTNNPPPHPPPPVQPPVVPPHPVPQPPTQPPPAPVPQPPHPAPQPQPTQPPPQPRYQNYVVRSGDTLSAIAARFHTTWPSLYQLNKSVVDQIAAEMHFVIPGGPWNNIRPGEVLKVPA